MSDKTDINGKKLLVRVIIWAVVIVAAWRVLGFGFGQIRESSPSVKTCTRPTPRPPEKHSFKLRPGEQYVINNHEGLVTQADWYDVFTIVILDFGAATKQYQGWDKADIFISPMEMRRAEKIVYIRPTTAEFMVMLRSGQIRRRGHAPNPQVAGYDVTLADFRK